LRIIELAACRYQLLPLFFNLIGSLIQLPLKARDKLDKNGIRAQLRSRLWRRTHDASLIADILMDKMTNRQYSCAFL
jgi:hypothetical protein